MTLIPDDAAHSLIGVSSTSLGGSRTTSGTVSGPSGAVDGRRSRATAGATGGAVAVAALPLADPPLGRHRPATVRQVAHQRRREPVDRPAAPTAAAGDEHLGHHREVTLGDRVRHRDDRGRAAAQRLGLGLEPDGSCEPERLGGLRLGEPDRLDPRGFGPTGELHVRGFALALVLARLGFVGLDLHAHLRAGELRLHVGGALRLLHLDA